MSLSIDMQCAFSYWMSDVAELSPQKRGLASESLLERIAADSLPGWAYGDDGLVHVVVNSKHGFINRKGVHCRVIKSPLPRDSFVYSQEGVPVVSPECCFLRLATELSLPELVKAGSMLCSQFSFSHSGVLLKRARAITSKSKITSYVESVHDVAGIKKARRALRFLVDNAASPPEIDTTLLLCMPALCGGYGIPFPELNGHVPLNEAAATTLGYSNCYCDLLWRKARCAVEYTSELHHAGYKKQAEDETRRAAIGAMGYRVHLLTKPQLYNQDAFEGIARLVSRAIGRQMPRKTLAFYERQRELRRVLLHEQSPIIEHACMHRDDFS